MSRLIEALERHQKGTTAPMGFGFQRAAQRERPPAMALVAASAKVDQVLQAAKLSDAVLFQSTGHAPSAASLKKLAEGAEEACWGVKSDQVVPEQLGSLKEQGCDFVVFSALETSLDALKAEDFARVLVLPKGLTEEQARTLESAPIDVIIAAEPITLPISLQALMDLATARWAVSKPYLQTLSGVPSVWELECLRDIGVDGVVLLTDAAGPDALKTLHDRLREVPAKRPGKNDRAVALLPQMSSSGSRRAVPEPPDEDDDDDE